VLAIGADDGMLAHRCRNRRTLDDPSKDQLQTVLDLLVHKTAFERAPRGDGPGDAAAAATIEDRQHLLDLQATAAHRVLQQRFEHLVGHHRCVVEHRPRARRDRDLVDDHDVCVSTRPMPGDAGDLRVSRVWRRDHRAHARDVVAVHDAGCLM
jgi:hypothetical protein